MLLDDLTKIANDTTLALAQKASVSLQKEVNKIGDRPPQTQNNSPMPDFTAMAARAQESAAGFMDSKVFGIGMPLLLAAGVAAYLILRRK